MTAEQIYDKAYNKRYRETHKEEILAYSRQWRNANREHIKEYDSARYRQNREKEIARAKTYQSKNKLKVTKTSTARRKHRRHTDPLYKLKSTLRTRLSNVLRSRKTRKNNPTIVLIGCSVEQLRDYLTPLFQPGMTWENHGEWHIDHVKPCASFDLTSPEEQKKCFHYSNLQPLWAKDNLVKKDRVLC